MKNTILIFLLALLFSCENETNKSNEEEKIVTEPEIVNIEKQESEPVIIEDTTLKQEKKDYLGYYVGEFKAVEFAKEKSPTYSNKINISIDSLFEDRKEIFGHSVVAGNSRPFSGFYTINENKKLAAKVNEPGDDKYDGSFNFELNLNSNILEGEWFAYDQKLSVTKRKYKLNFEKFVYKPENNIEIYANGTYPILNNEFFDSGEHEAISADVTKNNASIKKLKESDVENLSKSDLGIIRNLIYARHGYSFKNRRMRYFFENGWETDWYIPVSTDVREELTDLEEENIALIKRYEEHAEKYYDYFGR